MYLCNELLTMWCKYCELYWIVTKSLTMIQNSEDSYDSKSFKAVGGHGHDRTPTSETLQDKSLWELSWRGSRIKNPDLCENPCIYVQAELPGRHCDCLDREDQSSMCFVHQIILRLAFRTRKQLQQIKLVQLHYEIRGCKAMRGQHIFKHRHHGHPPMSVNVLKRLKRFENHEAEQRADTWGCSRPVCSRCLGTCCISQTILDLPCVAL